MGASHVADDRESDSMTADAALLGGAAANEWLEQAGARRCSDAGTVVGNRNDSMALVSMHADDDPSRADAMIERVLHEVPDGEDQCRLIAAGESSGWFDVRVERYPTGRDAAFERVNR
jgi:hypothetical protein